MTLTLTLTTLQQRCTLCPECEQRWQWPGALQQGRYPITTIADKQHYVRRLAYQLANPGKAMPTGRRHCIRSLCDNLRCINPSLLIVMTKSAILRQAVQDGRFQTPVARAKVAVAMRRRSKLTDEAVAQIRASTDSDAATARRHGISGRYAALIRRGTSRVDYAGNPFARLMT